MSGRVPIFEGLPTSERFYEMFSSQSGTNQEKIDPNSNELQLPFIPYMKLRDPHLHSRNVPAIGRHSSKVSCDSDSTNDSFLPPSPISSTNNDSLLGIRPLNSPWSSMSSSPSSRTNSSKESFSDVSEISHNLPPVRPVKKHSNFSIDSILSKSDTKKQREEKPKTFSIKRISQLSAEQPSKRKRTEETFTCNQPIKTNRNGFPPQPQHLSLKTALPYSNPSTPVHHQNTLLKAYVHDYYRMTLANQEAALPCHGFPTPPITPRLAWPMSNIQNIQTPLMNNYGASPEINGYTQSITARSEGAYCSPHADEEKGKRARTIFTTQQLERLEIEFSKQHYMVGTERYYLARQLNLKESQVKVWFQNRRIKWRKQKQQDVDQNESAQVGKKSNFATLREQALAKSM